MERKKSLATLLQELGCRVENEAVLDKCLELCNFYNKNIEKFIELWIQFCINKNTDVNINITLDNLLEMEKIILRKDKLEDLNITYMKCQEDEHETDDVLHIYGSSNAGNSLIRKRKRSEAEIDADVSILASTSVEGCTAATYYDNMKQPDKILVSVGKIGPFWTTHHDLENIKIKLSCKMSHIDPNIRYMFEVLHVQRHIRSYVAQQLGKKLIRLWSAATKANNATNVIFLKNVKSISRTHFRTFGRILKKENKVILQGFTRKRMLTPNRSVELDFHNLKSEYSVFSGQIVAVEGTHTLDDKLYVNKIFAKAYAPKPCPPRFLSRINIFVAAGPFTASDNMLYQPLWDLMKEIAVTKPHVLILIGPFIDHAHLEVAGYSKIYQDFFEKLLINILQLAKDIQVILVPSNRDAHHQAVYPTSRYEILNKNIENCTNLKLMPDPCILNIEGIKLGITSVDVIKHIGKEEISNISGKNRLSRLADHMLTQSCFYPVCPPPRELNVNIEMWEKHTFFDEQPHLLILPSDMRYYCKVVNDCMILNPERLNKRIYARLSIKPMFDDWHPDNISCDIVKLYM